MNKRFKELAEGYGFRIEDTFALINNVWTRRPDTQSVTYKGHHIMTIPRKMYGEPNPQYRTLDGVEQPMYFDREYKLRNWNLIIKNTDYIKGLEEKKFELDNLEKLYEKK